MTLNDAPHKLHQLESRALLTTPLSPALYPRGTFFAAAALIFVAVYYDHAWRRLKSFSTEFPTLPAPITSETHHWPELRYLQWGRAVSVLSFLLAGAADTPPTSLDHLVGALMDFCGAIFAAMFALGLVSLWNLWGESIRQLKDRLYLKRLVRSNPQAQGIKTGSFLRAIPVATLWLAAGFAVLIGLGTLVDILPHWLNGAFKELVWLVIALAFYNLWRGTSQPAMLLRLVLLTFFSAIILAATIFGVAWAASETAPLLVTLLAAITTLNAVFYARGVRLKALVNNLE